MLPSYYVSAGLLHFVLGSVFSCFLDSASVSYLQCTKSFNWNLLSRRPPGNLVYERYGCYERDMGAIEFPLIITGTCPDCSVDSGHIETEHILLIDRCMRLLESLIWTNPTFIMSP